MKSARPARRYYSILVPGWRSGGGGSVAILKSLQESNEPGIRVAILGSHLEQLFNKLNLTPNVIAPHPPNLPLPDHVHRFIALNRSPRRMEFSEALLGVDPAFNRDGLAQ